MKTGRKLRLDLAGICRKGTGKTGGQGFNWVCSIWVGWWIGGIAAIRSHRCPGPVKGTRRLAEGLQHEGHPSVIRL